MAVDVCEVNSRGPHRSALAIDPRVVASLLFKLILSNGRSAYKSIEAASVRSDLSLVSAGS